MRKNSNEEMLSKKYDRLFNKKLRRVNSVRQEKWEESRAEAKDLAQDYLDKKKLELVVSSILNHILKYLLLLQIDGITESMMNLEYLIYRKLQI